MNMHNKILYSFIFLFFGFTLFVYGAKPVSAAGPIFCSPPDQNLICGMTSYYNMFGACELSGSDLPGNGTRVLGGQKCSLGGTGDGGYYMIGTGEPDSSTVTHSYGPGTTPPGWTYAKSGNLKSSIPLGEFSDDINYIHRFFGGSVSTSLYDFDDETMLQVGNDFSHYTGCWSDGFRSVYSSNCPASIFVGDSTIDAKPGDVIVFDVQNDLRPNNGYGMWGKGNVLVGLNEITTCETADYLNYLHNSNPSYYNYQNIVNYHPTAAGVCTPETPACSINSFLYSRNGFNNYKVSWNVSGVSSVNISGGIGTQVAVAYADNVKPGSYTLSATGCADSSPLVIQGEAALSAKWDDNSTSKTITASPGQQITIPFTFWNSGEAGSSVNVTDCPPSLPSGFSEVPFTRLCPLGSYSNP